jgi:polyisoprenoid-binding protein YceI
MVMHSEVTRVLDGREIPAPGMWFIDPVHSEVEVVARHMMVSRVRGRFRTLSGAIVIDPIPERSSAEVTIDAASIDTGDETRDEHLRSADFLDVERFPVIRFVSVAVEPMPPLSNLDADKWQVDGDLTVRDVTRRISLELELGGAVVDPWGTARAGFVAWTEIERDEFGITWNQALEAGGFLVGKTLKVEIEIEAVRQPDA